MRLCCFALLCVAAWSAVLAETALPWWKTAIFYQVYPRSFKDSNGDGVGDLKGITQVADYFKEIGVTAIWLSPIYKSPMADFGYDISNYTAIEPVFGDMDDFRALRAKLKEIDIKLVLDFVPNHSSDEHVWFQRSVNPEDPLHEDYKDFYVWRDPKGINETTKEPIPPNNWISVFSGSSWEYRKERNQFYLHNFVKKQPDLNYRCENVRKNMSAVLKFWLDEGVDGFRMDAVKYIFENSTFPDELPVPKTAGDTYDNLQHTYEQNQPETFQLLREWADIVSDRVTQDGRERAIFLEVYDTLPTTIKYYGTGKENIEFPFNFILLAETDISSRPGDYKRLIDQWIDSMPRGSVANWVVGNHDNRRVYDRYGHEMVDGINMMTMVLPGIKVTYNGAEIGMQDTYIRWDQTVDPQGILLGKDHYMEGTRDPERTPMQWDDSVSAGFSTNSTTWLPVNPNYWWLNVAAQRKAEFSHMKVYQAVARARKDPVMELGELQTTVPNNDTLLIIRSYNDTYYVLILNMGSTVYTYTSQNLFAPHGVDVNMTVVIGSINSGFTTGSKLQQGSLNVVLKPKAALLLRSGSLYVPPSPSPSGAAPLLLASPLALALALLACSPLRT